MNHLDIRRQFDNPGLTPDDIFKLVRSVAYFHQRSDTSIVDSLDLIIRLVDQRDRLEKALGGSGAMIDAIARQAGLYPYVQGKGSWRDQLAHARPWTFRHYLPH